MSDSFEINSSGQSGVANGTHSFVLHPDITTRSHAHAGAHGLNGSAHARVVNGAGATRTPAARLSEAVSLATSLDLDVVGHRVARVSKIRPATLLGAGVVAEIGADLARLDVELVVVDTTLSPVQQRNLEKAWSVKVLDRTGLILEIFSARAQTREGQLQVELAHLTYQKSRLVRSWTHLERQRGGLGFVGGPGETQIEADRRMIQKRISVISHDLESVKRTRTLHRKSRTQVPYPTVAFVGYTNAGKSTLFNRLTGAAVAAQDQLFATLDPTMRRFRLPHGTQAILSDTVGFISDLPTHLVAAFRATLEEVTTADLVVHVRDIANPDTGAQASDVAHVLHQLFGDMTKPVIEVWNKIDLLDESSRGGIENIAKNHQDHREDAVKIPVSATTGEGLERLASAIEAHLNKDYVDARVKIDAGAGQAINWLYENCEILARREPKAGTLEFTVRVAPAKQAQLAAQIAGFGSIE